MSRSEVVSIPTHPQQNIASRVDVGSDAMAEVPRKKTLEELKNEAITEFERRGYDVRGKTPAQIRELLKRNSKKNEIQRAYR